MHEYIEDLIKNGYIDKEGKPLKCKKCDNEVFTRTDEMYCPYGLEEYSYTCNVCGSIEGYWAHGYWQV